MAKIGYVPVHREPFSVEHGENVKKRTLRELKKLKIKFVSPEGLVFNESTAERCAALFLKEKVEGIFLQHVTFGAEEAALEVVRLLPEVPILLGASKEPPFDEKGNQVSGSCCGKYMTSYALHKMHRPYIRVADHKAGDKLFKRGILEFNQVCEAVSAIRKARIGLVGPRPADFHSCAYDETLLKTTLGPKTIPITLAQVFRLAREIKSKDNALQLLIKEITFNFPSSISKVSLEKAARLEIALKQLIGELNLTALAIQCWTEMQSSYGLVPCFTMGRLTDQGIMSACEADVIGCVTMIIEGALVKKPPFFIDIVFPHQKKKNIFFAWHCGNAPQSLAAGKVRSGLHPIMPDKDGITTELRIREGEVTVARLLELDHSYKMFIGVGEVVDLKDNLRGSYGWVKVNDWERWDRTLMDEGFCHHYSIAYGNISTQLLNFCKIMGIKEKMP